MADENAADAQSIRCGQTPDVGQPARCVRTETQEWGGTLRVGLSMPQIVEFAALENAALGEALRGDMRRIADALRSAS